MLAHKKQPHRSVKLLQASDHAGKSMVCTKPGLRRRGDEKVGVVVAHLTTTSKVLISLRWASFSGPFPTIATAFTPGSLKAVQRGLCSGSCSPKGSSIVAFILGSFP